MAQVEHCEEESPRINGEREEKSSGVARPQSVPDQNQPQIQSSPAHIMVFYSLWSFSLAVLMPAQYRRRSLQSNRTVVVQVAAPLVPLAY